VTETRFVRLDMLNDAGLTADEQLAALTLAVRALRSQIRRLVISEPASAAPIGPCRLDRDGELMIPVTPETEGASS
jgi:hypothetical protein